MEPRLASTYICGITDLYHHAQSSYFSVATTFIGDADHLVSGHWPFTEDMNKHFYLFRFQTILFHFT